jgi:hypothetical protein
MEAGIPFLLEGGILGNRSSLNSSPRPLMLIKSVQVQIVPGAQLQNLNIQGAIFEPSSTKHENAVLCGLLALGSS